MNHIDNAYCPTRVNLLTFGCERGFNTLDNFFAAKLGFVQCLLSIACNSSLAPREVSQELAILDSAITAATLLCGYH